ncbi:hypothetical protein M0804_000027 [Polistes exclamans]|nr:hypothetical protein M0804_000027 [Polistes exclamans]
MSSSCMGWGWDKGGRGGAVKVGIGIKNQVVAWLLSTLIFYPKSSSFLSPSPPCPSPTPTPPPYRRDENLSSH